MIVFRRTGDQPFVPRTSQRLRQRFGVHQHTTGQGTRNTRLSGVATVLQIAVDQDVEFHVDRHQQRHGQGVLRSLHFARGRGFVVRGRVRTIR